MLALVNIGQPGDVNIGQSGETQVATISACGNSERG